MSRHSYDVGSYGGGGSNLTMGAGSSSKTKQTKIKDDLLETYRNSKFYPIALAIHSGFNKGRGKLTDNQKIIFEKLLNLNSSITPKVYEKDEEILSKQSEYIMKHMPEYQTQVGTVNMSNEDVVSRVDQLLTAKAIQYDERGALDQNRPDDYDPDTVAAIRQNKTKTACYQIVKNYDGSATLVISSGIGKAQRVPVTSSEFMTYFPEYSRRNIVSDIKSAVMASPNKTTNLSGTMDPVNARMDGFTIPGLIGSGLEEKVRYDVIGSPFNDGSDNDKFQVVMYFNSSKGWVTKVVNESEYATEQGVSNIINNIVPYTISTMLK
jgi:hypothetical protein